MTEYSRSQLRPRGFTAIQGKDNVADPENPPSPNPPPRKRISQKLKADWDSLFWMFVSFALLYFTDFASNILFNERLRRDWLAVSLFALGTSMGCLVYSMLYHPKLNATNWNTEAPILTAIATVTALVGCVCFAIAVWPVWHLLTVIILPTLFMGFISTVSLFNL